MTNEEKINRLRNIQGQTPIYTSDDIWDLEALEAAIEAVETLDKIESRLGNVFEEEDDRLIAVNMFKELEAGIRADNELIAVSGMSVEELTDAFTKGYRLVSPEKSLPPVTPQPKTGRWIRHDNGKYHWYLCACCDAMAGSDEKKMAYNYCPNCGAKMVDPQERNDKQ